MRFWAHDRHDFPLPDGHKFPLAKYRRLRERLVAEGVASPDDVVASAPASWELLGTVHAASYLDRVRTGAMTDREIRVLGLPWSAALVERGRRSTMGTVDAARDALGRGGYGMNLGGGTHHAGRAAGRGYCLFNDLAVAVSALRAEGFFGRVAIVDCDVHQGDGTAELFTDDPSVFTLSIHGGANYPFKRATSDLDVDLRDGTRDDDYLLALSDALDVVGDADLVFYLAAADPWEGDRLGRLALTKGGLAARDALVLDRAAAWGAAVCVVLAGGYAPDVRDTVEINLATARAVAERAERKV